MVRYNTFILFGAPGSGKGTQGKTLGTIPRYYHCACGDVFRSIDTRTKVGKAFLDYSSKGRLVPAADKGVEQLPVGPFLALLRNRQPPDVPQGGS